MIDDRTKVDDTDSREPGKPGLSPAQVAAAALAAVTAAFLCSTLGVYGTVVGAGLLSVVTTVGSELFMRSLERTRAAAQLVAGRRKRRERQADLDKTVYLPAPSREQLDEYQAMHQAMHQARERTRVLASSGEAANARERRQWWRRRGPVLAATSALAFVIGMLVVTGYEGVTGKALSGDGSTTVSSIVRGGAPDGEHRSPQDGLWQRDDGGTTSTSVPPDERESQGDQDGEDGGTGQDGRDTGTVPSGETEPTEPTQPTEQPDESTPVDEGPGGSVEPSQEPSGDPAGGEQPGSQE
ncbi:hypothetical protein AB8O38_11465 [Saccharomonospora xinjiangensis]|uniref:hypothetical protein n=1 Tax=Saccharomonospora xinjiangensis TaxID=75294 RepID=UPI00350F0227